MKRTLRGVLITLGAFALVVGALWIGVAQVNTRDSREQATALRDAVRRATMLCYAVEGRYPTSADELCERYGLPFDHDRFIVAMDSFTSNLFPDIRVLSVGGGEYD